MIKGHYSRLMIAWAIILSVLLTGLGIVLGQFFHLFATDVNARIQQTYWVFLLFTLVIAFLLTLFISARVMLQYAKPIDEVTQVAKQLASGDYLVRASATELDSELALAINQTASTLQEISILRTMEKERLKTLVESIGSSLLMLGREGAVNLSNGVFEQTFGFSKKEFQGKSYRNIGLPETIESLIEDVFLTEQAHERQVRLEMDGTVTHLSVYGAPVIGRHGNWLGIIVVMHNITKLIQLEEVRKDFVANVSHELRTPITSIKGFTETLMDGAIDDPAIRTEFLGIIAKESERLQGLVNDLLQLSGIERQGFSLTIAQINFRKVVDDALNIVFTKLQRKKMEVSIQMPEHVFLAADADRLIQVMVNLLSNAINYSKAETKITIAATMTSEHVNISIQDEGIGIEATELTRLFERFYRVDRARSRESGGTGLGLAIVKHLIEAHHGTVHVESAVGVGTTFFIHLPRKQKDSK